MIRPELSPLQVRVEKQRERRLKQLTLDSIHIQAFRQLSYFEVLDDSKNSRMATIILCPCPGVICPRIDEPTSMVTVFL
jgi:hypothetical protein